jgi:hypothetical protein
LTKPRAPFVWAEDDEPDKLTSEEGVAARLDICAESVRRIPDKPPAVFIGRLRKYSCHDWNAWLRRQREAPALKRTSPPKTEAAPAPVAPIAPEPPVRRKRGRPPGSKNRPKSMPTAARVELEAG